MKFPAGTTCHLRGHLSHSLKMSFGLSERSSAAVSRPRRARRERRRGRAASAWARGDRDEAAAGHGHAALCGMASGDALQGQQHRQCESCDKAHVSLLGGSKRPDGGQDAKPHAHQAQCPLRSESDRNTARRRNDANRPSDYREKAKMPGGGRRCGTAMHAAARHIDVTSNVGARRRENALRRMEILMTHRTLAIAAMLAAATQVSAHSPAPLVATALVEDVSSLPAWASSSWTMWAPAR